MMNCDTARELIELHFGSNDLPQELQFHLSQCNACQIYRTEMTRLVDGLGSDTDLPFSPADFERVAAAVDREISRSGSATVAPIKWLRPMMRVAAAVLIVAASFGLGRLSDDFDPFDTEAGTSFDNGDVMAIWVGDLADELNDEMVSILIDDYSAAGFFGAGEALLGDISEDEMEYLVKNFEVGELL